MTERYTSAAAEPPPLDFRVGRNRLQEQEWKARAAWMLTWIAGCALVDAALGLTGPWAMLGGVATWHACEWVYDRLTPNG